MTATAERTIGDAQMMRRVSVSAYIGSAIEWYDFFLYGTAAAVVFNTLFFPDSDPLVGTMQAFVTFAAGFFARPIGGIIAGHLGDRIGRKQMLVATLLVMGISTTLMGLLPTTEQIGIAAPVLLVVLRLLQGLAVGGEWAGAALIVTEHAPAHRKGFFGAFPAIGIPSGMILANLVFGLMTLLPQDQFLAWGWRIPFLLSAVMVAVGLYIRARVPESKEFKNLKDTQTIATIPFVEAFKGNWRQILLVIGIKVGDNMWYYVIATFGLTYLTTHLGLDKTFVLFGLVCAAAVELVTMPLFGALSDRIGRKPVMAGAAAGVILLPWLWFPLVDTKNAALIIVAWLIALSLVHAACEAVQSAWFTEMFPVGVRYSGISIAFQIGGSLGGGPAPYIATGLLLAYGGSTLPLMSMVAGAGVLFLVCVLLSKDSYGKNLRGAK